MYKKLVAELRGETVSYCFVPESWWFGSDDHNILLGETAGFFRGEMAVSFRECLYGLEMTLFGKLPRVNQDVTWLRYPFTEGTCISMYFCFEKRDGSTFSKVS